MKLSYLNSALACYSSVRWCMSVLDRSWGERVKHTKRLHLSLTKAIYHPILAEIACLALYFQLRPTTGLLDSLPYGQSNLSLHKSQIFCCTLKTIQHMLPHTFTQNKVAFSFMFIISLEFIIDHPCGMVLLYQSTLLINSLLNLLAMCCAMCLGLVRMLIALLHDPF